MSCVLFCFLLLAFPSKNIIEGTLIFPEDFIFGAGSSAYQVEGSWNVSGPDVSVTLQPPLSRVDNGGCNATSVAAYPQNNGLTALQSTLDNGGCNVTETSGPTNFTRNYFSDKGESVWDHFTHNYPEKISDHSTGDYTTDSYSLYKKDVAALKELGVNAYRFSISWTRLLPTGFINKKSEDGKRYYNELINELLKNGIEPVVTLYHWDLPQNLMKFGGFTNKLVISAFVDYAEYAFELFGDRVKTWVTFNEISVNCVSAYGTQYFAPGLHLPGRAEYLCAHHMILAHAYTYRMYHKEFGYKQKGAIGMVHHAIGYTPLSNATEDIAAADLAFAFSSGWILHPIMSKDGDYPIAMKDFIRRKSTSEKLKTSRLPEFSAEEINLVKGTYDYMGINHYTSFAYSFEATLDEKIAIPIDTAFLTHPDLPCYTYKMTKWDKSEIPIYSSVPHGFEEVLVRINQLYGRPKIIITENGLPLLYSSDDLNDYRRVDYLKKHLKAVLEANKRGANIVGYFYWSLTDNFEWISGYELLFGLYAVNCTSPTKERIGRLSSRVYKDIIKTRRLNELPAKRYEPTII